MNKQDAFDAMNSGKSTNTGLSDPRKEGSKSKGGRPTKVAADKRTHKITAYLSTNELAELTRYCESVGVQPAVFVRTQALKAAKVNT